MIPSASLPRLLAGLVLVGLALRTQILVVGPLIPRIQQDLGISHGVAGLLGTIPVLCMALMAPLGPVLAASVGPRLGVAICVLAVGGFGLIRALVPGAPAVMVATIGIGAGMAVVGPVLSMFVRARTPRHAAAGTGAYVAGMVIGGTVAAGLAVTLADAFGGWRWAFGLISAFAAVSLIAWLWLIPAEHGVQRSAPRRPRLPWRRSSAWLIGLVFGSQSVLFYGSISWLASAYVERGWSDGDAAILIAVFNGVGLLATLSVPFFADRIGTRRSQLAAAGLVAAVGSLAIALTPGEGPGSLISIGAAGLLGIGIGAFFPLSLALPVDVADGPSEAASISAFMLLVGYLFASVSPVMLGVIRDATGSFTVVLWLLVAMAAAMVPLALSLGEGRLRRAGT
ncbi:MAG: MFS transporter [Candidatus Limnocylindrales bacterium]